MFINFPNLAATCQPERLTYSELVSEKKRLIDALFHGNIDPGLIQWVDELLDQAHESGYDGGYSDAHWYAKGIGDGA
jgi:hypothetical protein